MHTAGVVAGMPANVGSTDVHFATTLCLIQTLFSIQPLRGMTTPIVESADSHTHRMSTQALLFRIIPVILYGPKGMVETYAFLDEGSSLTLVEDELANNLGVDGNVVPSILAYENAVPRLLIGVDNLRLTLPLRVR